MGILELAQALITRHRLTSLCCSYLCRSGDLKRYVDKQSCWQRGCFLRLSPFLPSSSWCRGLRAPQTANVSRVGKKTNAISGPSTKEHSTMEGSRANFTALIPRRRPKEGIWNLMRLNPTFMGHPQSKGCSL